MTERTAPGSKAQAIAAEVRRRIVDREWRQGDRIPDEAELAVEFGVARAGASLPYTLVTLGLVAGGVLMGRLSDRFGVAVPAAIGSVSLGLGYLVVARMESLLAFSLVYGAMMD